MLMMIKKEFLIFALFLKWIQTKMFVFNDFQDIFNSDIFHYLR